MTVHRVSSGAELLQALANANAGDRIDLAAGHYGDLSIQNMHFASNVTIRSADANNPAEFHSIKLYQSDNLTFDNVAVRFEPDSGTVEWDSAITLSGCSDITFRNSTITGGNAVNGIPADSAPADAGANGIEGYPIGRAVTAHYSDNLTFDNNEFSSFKTGISLAHVDGLVVTDNELSLMRTTLISGGHVDNADITGNHFSDLTPWRSMGGGDHGDFIHFWTIDGQGSPSENLTFTDNFFEQGDSGGSVMGIYIEDNGKGIGYRNILIENNVIHNGDSQGLTIENTDGLVIRDNTLLQSSGDVNDAPGILLLYGTRNTVVDNNVMAGIWGSAYNLAAQLNIDLRPNNLFVQRLDPELPNYIDDLFVNALTPNAELSDLLVIPGSAADGVGASLTQYDPASGETVLAISQAARSGFNMQTVDLRAFEVYEGTDGIDLDTARVRWFFGDGETENGHNVSHTYAAPGDYVVAARIVNADGSETVVRKHITVETPHVLAADFESGAIDTTPEQNTVTLRGNASLVHTELGRSLNLNDQPASLQFGLTQDMQNNPEYTLTFAFKANPNVNDDGMMVYFSGTSYIRLMQGGLQFNGLTSEGETYEFHTARGVNVDDGNWHHVAFTFSQELGLASFYLDGDLVGQASGLEGSQRSSYGQGLNLGNPFGDSFAGLFDNITFDRGAMSALDVVRDYNDLRSDLGLTLVDMGQEGYPQNGGNTDNAGTGTAPAAGVSLTGGTGSDTLIGSAGDDTISGGIGATDISDTIYAGEGEDSVIGGYGNDELRGDAGNDTLRGSYGTDLLIGGTGNDVLSGGAVSDRLFGGDGNDFLNGGVGFDRLNGGAGADHFYHAGLADHGRDWIQDYSASQGDILHYGGAARMSDFLVQFGDTANAGVAGVREAFVSHIPSGNLLWALIDGETQDHIYVQAGGQVYDLLA